MSALRTVLASLSLLLIGTGTWSLLTDSGIFELDAVRAPAILSGLGGALGAAAVVLFEWQKRQGRS